MPLMPLEFSLNGRPIDASDADPHQPLLHFLRERGLTGTKEGCAEGECGACAVVVVRRDAQGRTRYEPINSCLVLVGAVADQEVISVEGVARDGTLHPVQQAMVEHGGSQCGYCTPGFVMSLFAEYYRPDREEFDPESISGNLCRCTGYRPIRDAAKSLGRPVEPDDFKRRLALAPPSAKSVALQNGHGFFRPTTLAEALSLLDAHPGATIIAGGTDLVVEINQRYRSFQTLISIDEVAELRHFASTDDAFEIGAALTLTEVEQHLDGRIPILSQLFPLFSSRLIRNRATFGGNLMNASPIGDGPPALLALGAEVELTSSRGTRRLPLSDFFVGYRKTRAERGELLTRVFVPRPLPGIARFYKVSKRVLDDISTVAAAFALSIDGGVIREARLAYGGVAATPVRALDAERELTGKPWVEATVQAALPILSQCFKPIDDHRGSAAYRRSMVTKLFQKFFAETRGGAA